MRSIRLGALFLLLLLSCGQSRASTTQLARRVRAAVSHYAVEKLRLPAQDVVVEFPDLSQRVKTLSAAGEPRVLPSQRGIRRGIQILRCGIFAGTELVQAFRLKVRIRTFGNVPVSKHQLPRHAVVTKDDFVWQRRETTRLNRHVQVSEKEIVGKRTRRIVQADEILTDSLLEPLPVVARGNNVDIYFHKGALEIVLPGVARQDGAVGETIRVKCLETRKEFEAKIVDSSTVIVNL